MLRCQNFWATKHSSIIQRLLEETFPYTAALCKCNACITKAPQQTNAIIDEYPQTTDKKNPKRHHGQKIFRSEKKASIATKIVRKARATVSEETLSILDLLVALYNENVVVDYFCSCVDHMIPQSLCWIRLAKQRDSNQGKILQNLETLMK